MNIRQLLWSGLSANVWMLGSGGLEAVQAENSLSSSGVLDFMPASGDVRDLEGLQERQITDLFPPTLPTSEPAPTPLEVNRQNYQPTVNDPAILQREENNWRNNAVGDPKESGPGIPFKRF